MQCRLIVYAYLLELHSICFLLPYLSFTVLVLPLIAFQLKCINRPILILSKTKQQSGICFLLPYLTFTLSCCHTLSLPYLLALYCITLILVPYCHLSLLIFIIIYLVFVLNCIPTRYHTVSPRFLQRPYSRKVLQKAGCCKPAGPSYNALSTYSYNSIPQDPLQKAGSTVYRPILILSKKINQ